MRPEFSGAALRNDFLIPDISAGMQTPTVSTNNASGVSQTSATLNASYNSNNSATTLWFQIRYDVVIRLHHYSYQRRCELRHGITNSISGLLAIPPTTTSLSRRMLRAVLSMAALSHSRHQQTAVEIIIMDPLRSLLVCKQSE